MAKINEYKTIAEKNKFFKDGDIKVVINIESIFDKLDEFAATHDFIFRGCSEAKYMLYNSAQRTFIESELYLQSPKAPWKIYNNWIENLIEECKLWNSGTVLKLLKANGINENNSLAYLSFMQHNKVPTPLIDFTRDPYIALFFAIDSTNEIKSLNEIDNYFSIYYTYSNNQAFNSWNHVFNRSIPKIETGVITYDDINKNLLQLLHPDNEVYRLLNNSNIINQKGLFFYNNNCFQPMEQCYLDFINPLKKEFGKERFDKYLLHDYFASCFNIHKSLIPYIKEKLKSKGITREFIYPDPSKLKEQVLHNSFCKSIFPRKPTE